nr:hypothetical protein [Fredinandcohnia onubensis]
MALKWDEFNEKQGIIRICKTLYNPKKISVLTPKTKGSVRTIKIGETLINMLRKLGLNKKILN